MVGLKKMGVCFVIAAKIGILLAPTVDVRDLGTWLPITGSLLLALLGSSVLSTLINRWFLSRADHAGTRRKDARRALDAARDLRTRYLRLATSKEPGTDEGKLARLSNELYVAAAFFGDEEVLGEVTRYIRYGERYAARDDYVSAAVELQQFLALVRRLQRFLD